MYQLTERLLKQLARQSGGAVLPKAKKRRHKGQSGFAAGKEMLPVGRCACRPNESRISIRAVTDNLEAPHNGSTLRTTLNPVKSFLSPFFKLKRAGRRTSRDPVNQEPPRVMRELQIPRPQALPSPGASR